MEIWNLLYDGSHNGYYNMEFDSQLLFEKSKNIATPILRFYFWDNPTISLGYHQNENEINKGLCKQNNIDIVMRPTGGRAIYHWKELTYSIVVPAHHSLAKLSLIESYHQINKAISNGLNKIGIETNLSSGENNHNALKIASCFHSTSKYEIEYNGMKLVGSAQRRYNGAFLQQGSILLGDSYLDLDKYVIENKRSNIENKSISIKEILGKSPSVLRLIVSIVKGFEKEFDIKFKRIN